MVWNQQATSTETSSSFVIPVLTSVICSWLHRHSGPHLRPQIKNPRVNAPISIHATSPEYVTLGVPTSRRGSHSTSTSFRHRGPISDMVYRGDVAADSRGGVLSCGGDLECLAMRPPLEQRAGVHPRVRQQLDGREELGHLNITLHRPTHPAPTITTRLGSG